VSSQALETAISQEMTQVAMKVAKNQLHLLECSRFQKFLDFHEIIEINLKSGKDISSELEEYFNEYYDPVSQKPFVQDLALLLVNEKRVYFQYFCFIMRLRIS